LTAAVTMISSLAGKAGITEVTAWRAPNSCNYKQFPADTSFCCRIQGWHSSEQISDRVVSRDGPRYSAGPRLAIVSGCGSRLNPGCWL